MQSGLLIINNDLSADGIDSILLYISSFANEKFYVLLRSPLCRNLCEYTWKKYISLYYSSASHVSPDISLTPSYQVCPGLTISVLLPRTSNESVDNKRIFQVIVTDDKTADDNEIIELATSFGTVTDDCRICRHEVGWFHFKRLFIENSFGE